MEAKKYSTGTKGRIKMHADKCKEFILANVPNFSLGSEFIASLDGQHDETAWQRFQTPQDILPELQVWLGGGEPEAVAPAPAARLPVHPLPRAGSLMTLRERADEALVKTGDWLASAEAQAASVGLTNKEFAEVAVRRFHAEFLTVV